MSADGTAGDPIDFEQLRIRCGGCGAVQARAAGASRRENWLVYRFDCPAGGCDLARTGTLLEVPEEAGVMGGPRRIDLRHLSLRCAGCDGYPTLAHYRRAGDWNIYTFEHEDGGPCDPEAVRTFLEVHADADVFASRDPDWHGGKRHAGAESGGHG